MIIFVKVHPGAKEERIERITEGEYSVYVQARAEKGRANAAVIRLLAKILNIHQKNIKIKNPTSRKKMVEIK